MHFKNILCFILLYISNSYALTQFPNGTCKLEGYLSQGVNETDWYFTVNAMTEAATYFKLKAKPVFKEKINPKGQYVLAVIKIPRTTFSQYGQAEVEQVVHLLNPYRDVKIYNQASEVLKYCNKN